MKKTNLLHHVLAVVCVFGFLGCGDKDKPDKPEKKLIQYTVGQSLEQSFFAPKDRTHGQLDLLVQQGKVEKIQAASWEGASVYCLEVLSDSAVSDVLEFLNGEIKKSNKSANVEFVEECQMQSDLDSGLYEGLSGK